ncbi:hypothetical protein [Microbacterium gorillae]|uniref:hypothetical protein n=1 Tax=Microbacterium gorillae TaxID=1231063 RepID=UPI000693F848|nr:hypothetical protein [Microbacterium gorillae]
MSPALDVISAVAEVLSWLGGAIALLGAIVLIVLTLSQGPWHPARAVIESGDSGPVLRWFGRDGVGEARVRPEDRGRVIGKREVDVFVRPDVHDRFRWVRRGAAWRPVAVATVSAAGLWLACTIASLVIMAVGP